MTDVLPIETRYAGCRFRSRLEARWAVFFDAIGIPWQYEPQGFILSDGRKYLPDFLLPECGTWVECKGSSDRLDVSLMEQAARDLPEPRPRPGCEAGPTFMIVGPIPVPHEAPAGDYGWCSFDTLFPPPDEPFSMMCGFGSYHKNHRPWIFLDTPDTWGNPVDCLVPGFEPYEDNSAQAAYAAARAARFEYGESGTGPDDQSIARAVALGVEVALRELLHRRR